MAARSPVRRRPLGRQPAGRARLSRARKRRRASAIRALGRPAPPEVPSFDLGEQRYGGRVSTLPDHHRPAVPDNERAVLLVSTGFHLDDPLPWPAPRSAAPAQLTSLVYGLVGAPRIC